MSSNLDELLKMDRPELSGPLVQLLKSIVIQDSMTRCLGDVTIPVLVVGTGSVEFCDLNLRDVQLVRHRMAFFLLRMVSVRQEVTVGGSSSLVE